MKSLMNRNTGRAARFTVAAFAVFTLLADSHASAQSGRRRTFRRRPATRVKGKVSKKAKKKSPAAGVGKVKAPTGNGTSPLARVFAGNDGGAYYVSEFKRSGKKRVVWFAEHPGRGYAHVFRGVRTGSTIAGQYWSIPKAKATTTGQLKLRVNANGSLSRLSSTGSFPTRSWTVRSIKSFVSKLPGKTYPGFTMNTVNDLDGAFDDAKGFRYYVRQTGTSVFGVAEAPFKKGKQPSAVMVFIGKRSGNSVSGTVVAVPKGLKKGVSNIKFAVKSNRSLAMSSGIPFGGGPLVPVLPDIRVPIKDVMNIVNSQMNKVELQLDSYHNGPATRSYVKFGNGKPTYFALPYVTVKITKVGRKRQTFLNDIKSDIVSVKPLAGNLTRLSVIFETGGKELKRRMVGAVGNDDKRLADWDINNLRVDVEFKLVNYGKSISYEVKKVDLHAVVDVRALPEKLDKWIAGKVQPIVEKELKKELNKSVHRSKVANLVDAKLKSLNSFASKYKLFGYSASNLTPNKVFIDGNNLVIRFRN